MEVKKCGKCKCKKQLTEFYRDKSKNDGLTNYCKKCKNEIHYKLMQRKEEINISSPNWLKIIKPNIRKGNL